MKKRTRILLVAALVPAVVLGVAAPMALASGGSQRGLFDNLSLAAGMKGNNEVPPASTGDPDAAGYGVVDIDPVRGEVCVELAVGGTDTLTLFHIHRGAAGTNGPVVVDFTSLLPTTGLPAGELGCVDVDSRRLLTEILLRPGDFYLNAHNPAFMGGALRGQLVRVLGI
jgi:CHRD domain